MKTRGTLRRKALRWAVYTVTVVLLITTLVSIWFEFSASVIRVQKSDMTTYSSLDLDVTRGRFILRYTPRGGWELFTPIPEPGWDAGWSASRTRHYKYPPGSPFAPKDRWWHAPSIDRGYGIPTGPINELNIPLIYPTTILALLSAWMIHQNQKRHRPDHCPKCNYNLAGVESPICPECGRGDTP